MALTEHGVTCTLNDIACWTEDGYPILPKLCYTLQFCRDIGLRDYWYKSPEEQAKYVADFGGFDFDLFTDEELEEMATCGC